MITFSILSTSNPQVVNLQKVINEQSIISFQTTEKSIKFTINNNNIPIGNGEYTLGNETRWLTVNSPNNKKKGENFTLNLIDCLRLKICCTLTDSNSQQLRESNNSSKKPFQVKADSSMKTQISKKDTANSQTKSAKVQKKSSCHFNNSNFKKGESKKVNSNLKHNKSYEDGFETNNLLLAELSPRKPNDSFHKKTQYVQTRNINNYKGLISTKNQKFFGNKRNKSYENVSQHNRSNINTNQSLPKKIKEGLKTLDTMVLEKNYETNNKKEEMTIGGRNENKKGIFCITLEKNNNKTEDDITQSEREDKDQKDEVSFVLSKNQLEEESDNSNFSQLKEDFEILYTKEYTQTISKEMVRLELQLVIENICELQEAYHKEIMIELNNYEKYKELFANYSERYLMINKELLELKKEQERAHVMNIFNTFIDNHKIKHTKELLSINKREIGLWKSVPLSFASLSNRDKSDCNDANNNKDKMNIYTLTKSIVLKNKIFLNDSLLKSYERIAQRYLNIKADSEVVMKKNIQSNNQKGSHYNTHIRSNQIGKNIVKIH